MSDGINIQLMDGPLDVAAAISAVSTSEAGGIDVFIGTTRAERDESGRNLVALMYEAYAEMVTADIRRIVMQAQAQWSVLRVMVQHRIGRVPVGEASVVIAVSAAHRGEAFAACRHIIDEVKKTTPIWKKEIYAGAEKWQGEDATPRRDR